MARELSSGNVHIGRDASRFGGIMGYVPEIHGAAAPISNAPLLKAPAFQPPSAQTTPRELFTHHASEHTNIRCHEGAHRFVRRSNDREVLVYVDGSCLDQNDAVEVSSRRVGCAWTYKPAPYTPQQRSEAIRLEAQGPTGEEHPQTSNRAELRAAIGALQFRAWHGEGWRRMVLATDSEYVVLGITQRIENWVARGWRTSAGQPVKNQDLWKCLLDEINKFAARGLEVVFWRIPRELNTEADEAARNAAVTKPDTVEFATLHGVLV